MLARRFAQKSITEPPYEPQGVPACDKLLSTSVVWQPQRDDWLGALGELVQMCNEAVRRRSQCRRDASKPLSLEYMADRLDVDDPLNGFMIITRDQGWLQGFITYTTFTTWHRHFRWDSTHPCLSMLDEHIDNTGAAIDRDGSLARQLQCELHAGDPDNEGIVWPRIAEIGLLGGIGCGAWLVRLVIALLEGADSQYRFVVVQATDNSVPFYERMGFTRVGAISSSTKLAKGRSTDKLGTGSKPAASRGGSTKKGRGRGSGGRGGRVAQTTSSKAAPAAAEAPAKPAPAKPAPAKPAPAKAAKAEAGNPPGSMNGHETTTKVEGKKRKALAPPPQSTEVVSPHIWHTTEACESCATVAAQYDVDEYDVLFLNQRRFKNLTAKALLRKGTKLQVPIRQTEERVEEQLAAERQKWHVVQEDSTLKKEAQRAGVSPAEVLARNKERLKGLQLSSLLLKGTRLLLSGSEREYEEYCHWTYPEDDNTHNCPSYMMALRLRPHSERSEEITDPAILRLKQLLVPERPAVQPSGKRKELIRAPVNGAPGEEQALDPTNVVPPRQLFNRVVAVDGEDEHPYWYVLTYLPDLQWCHVAPLRQNGVFEGGPSAGRPRWMLLPEEEGGEMDVGAGRCRIMIAHEIKKTKANADEEEWDIVGPEN